MFIQNSLNQLWHYDGSIQVIEVGFGLLQVVFPSVDAVNWVLERRPWSISMAVMNMVPFSPPSVEVFNELQFMAIWIKLSRVPAHCITTRFGREFLPFFGEVLDVSLFGSRGRDAIFIKGLVKMDLLASFLGRRRACGPDCVPFWVRLHYENISSFCFRCGLLGHSSSRCPHTHLQMDHEARGPWMSIGRVGFRIVENSLQKYIQNQANAKKKKSEESEIGQFSFVTKEKRFGYTVHPLEDEPLRDDKDCEDGTLADSSKSPIISSSARLPPRGCLSMNNGRGTIGSDGLMNKTKQALAPTSSAPAAFDINRKMKTMEKSKVPSNRYIHPGRRRSERDGAANSSFGVGLKAAHPGIPPAGRKTNPHLLSTKRKLTFEEKGKGKMIEAPRNVPAKKWIPSKGIVIREPSSVSSGALSSSNGSGLPLKNQSSLAPSRLAGPSKIGNWIAPGKDIRTTDEGNSFPPKSFERRSFSLELIRNLYQPEDEEDEEDEALPPANVVRSAPTVAQPSIAGSPISSVNQPIQEASLEDVGWLRPIIGRWGDVSDSDDDDHFAELSMGEEEEFEVPKGESGEEDAGEEGSDDN
ncbi:hypothetical protein LINPERPRIM_LOCUS13653 [Linum perenne]